MCSEPVVGLTKARPVLVDHASLRADIEGLERLGRGDVENWLSRSAAVMSLSQIRGGAMHGRIPHDGVRRPSYRAARQGRSCDVDAVQPSVAADPTTPGVRLTVKGAGVRSGVLPSMRDHSNGLASLQELLEEHVLERLVAACLSDQGWDGAATVPFYAIFDAGFDFVRSQGERVRAGIAVRRCLSRPVASDLPDLGSREQRLVFETELRLRRYGVTSATTILQVEPRGADVMFRVRSVSEHEPRVASHRMPSRLGAAMLGATVVEERLELDRVNIQYGLSGGGSLEPLHLVDFGHYNYRARFDRGLVSLTCDGPCGVGGLLPRSSSSFVQPGSTRANPALFTACAADRRPAMDPWLAHGRRALPATYEATALADAVLSGRMTPAQMADTIDRWDLLVRASSSGAESVRRASGAALDPYFDDRRS